LEIQFKVEDMNTTNLKLSSIRN